MSYTIEQLRAWPPILHKWVEFRKINHAEPGVHEKYAECKRRARAERRGDGPGVYCVWNDGDLAYIGYSKTMMKRVNSYFFGDFGSGNLSFTGLPCATPEEAAALESDLIAAHKPIQNLRREPKGGQVRKGNPGKRSRYKIASYYGGR